MEARRTEECSRAEEDSGELGDTGWSFNLVPSLYGMAVLLHAKVVTLQFIFKNGHNLGPDYHFLMKLSGFLNYG